MSKPILFEISCDVVGVPLKKTKKNLSKIPKIVTLETKERLFHYSSRN